MGQHTETSPVTIGFGIQWPVDTKTGVSGRVALLEFAYQKVVYLVQVLADHWSNGQALILFSS